MKSPKSPTRQQNEMFGYSVTMTAIYNQGWKDACKAFQKKIRRWNRVLKSVGPIDSQRMYDENQKIIL